MTQDLTAQDVLALGGEAVPLDGGYSGETFLVGAAGVQAVLRLYGRQPARAAVDAALLDLLRGLLPVPRVLELRTAEQQAAEQQAGPAYLLTELLPGRRLDELLPTADAAWTRAVATDLGHLLVRLGGVPFRRPGMFGDASLLPDPGALPAGDLVSWVRLHLQHGPLSRWEADEREALLAVADRADVLLDEPTRTCLVHSDLNPKNLLVDPATGAVTGLVDWEFAHAGSPYADLGNLLRFERDPVLVDVVLASYADRAPTAPPDLLDRARAADLWALVELASRSGRHAVATRAHDLLRAIARADDLHAVPRVGA